MQWRDTNPTASDFIAWDEVVIQRPKPSYFVSIVAWFLIVTGVVAALYGGLSAFEFLGLSTSRLGSMVYGAIALSVMVVVYGGASLVAGVSLRARRSSGRVGAIGVLALSLLFDIYFFMLLLNAVMVMHSQMAFKGASSDGWWMAIGLLAGECFLSLLKIWVIYRLCSADVKRECGEAPW